MHFFYSLPLRNKILSFFFVLMAIVILIMGMISYWISERETKEIVTEYVIDMLMQVNQNLNINMDEVDSIVNSLLIDRDFCTSIRNLPDRKYEHARLRTDIENRLRAISKVKRDIGNMYILTNSGEIFTNNMVTTPDQYIKSKSWLEQINAGSSRLIISPEEVGTMSGVSPNIVTGQYFSIIRPAREIGSSGNFGMIAVDIDINFISRISYSHGSGRFSGDLIVMDKNSGIVYSKQDGFNVPPDLDSLSAILGSERGVYTELINGVSTLIVFENNEKYGWKLVEFIPMSTILAPARNIRNGIILIGLCSLAALVIASLILSDNITRPLRTLQQKMKDIEMGNLMIDVSLPQKDEVGQLADSLQTMLVRLQDSLEEIYSREREKRELELTLLQHQIYPHFLYNTLDSINWLARIQGAKTISSMITALNRMLHTSIFNGEEMNTLGEELDCIESYVLLQKSSYRNSFDIIYDIDENLKDCLVPKMTCQPLVENALIHGFADARSNARIDISAEQAGDRMTICIKDNGMGIEHNTLDRLMNMPQKNLNMFSGIGIKNIEKRLNLYYNGMASIKITSVPDTFTSVIMILPLWRKDKRA